MYNMHRHPSDNTKGMALDRMHQPSQSTYHATDLTAMHFYASAYCCATRMRTLV